MKSVRLATVEDVKAMSLIHSQTWKSAYTKYISYEYLNNIANDGWIPLFTRAFEDNLHEAAVFELEGKLTGTVTFGRGRPMTSCTTGDMSNSSTSFILSEQERNSCCSSDQKSELKHNSCCSTTEMSKMGNNNCCSTNELTKPETSCSDDSSCEEGEIISLYVLPQYWSTKQGYELTKFAVARLKSQGYKSCYLWVIKENERAVNFYKRFGFKSTNELTSVILAGHAVVEEKYRIDL